MPVYSPALPGTHFSHSRGHCDLFIPYSFHWTANVSSIQVWKVSHNNVNLYPNQLILVLAHKNYYYYWKITDLGGLCQQTSATTNKRQNDGTVLLRQEVVKHNPSWQGSFRQWVQSWEGASLLTTMVTMLSGDKWFKVHSATIRRRRFWHATHGCVAPYVDIILHRGRFWAKSAASGSVRWWFFGSCWMVLSHVMRGRPGCLLQSAGGGANRILLASALSSMRIICPNKVSRRDWIIAVVWVAYEFRGHHKPVS